VTRAIGTLILTFCILAPEPWERSIDIRNGISYIRVAEDLTATGIDSITKRDLITQLYVLSAITDPRLRDSAILGLASIELDEDFKLQLQSMEHQSDQLLVPSVILQSTSAGSVQPDSIDKLCSILNDIRKGKAVSSDRTNQLRPWGYLFKGGFDRFMRSSNQRRRTISRDTIESTLRVELAVLGGASLWSADYLATSGKPVALSLNDDLATMFKVDPTKRIRRNGEWVAR